MGSLTFRTTLVPRGPAAAVVLDDDQVAELGEGKKRFPVAANRSRLPGGTAACAIEPQPGSRDGR